MNVFSFIILNILIAAAIIGAATLGRITTTNLICCEIENTTPDYTESAVYEKHCEGGE